MFSRLDGRHLFEQILAGDESYRGEERDDSNGDAVVAGVGIVVVQALLFAIFVRRPALRRDAAEHDDGKQLQGQRDRLIYLTVGLHSKILKDRPYLFRRSRPTYFLQLDRPACPL